MLSDASTFSRLIFRDRGTGKINLALRRSKSEDLVFATVRPIFASVTDRRRPWHSSRCRSLANLRPFDHPEWVFELKYDAFRSLAIIHGGRCDGACAPFIARSMSNEKKVPWYHVHWPL
jgi:hypothetical protein